MKQNIWITCNKRITDMKHNLQNYQASLKTGLTPYGLQIKNSPGITPVSDDFNTQWKQVLYNTRKKLVELL